MRRITAFLLISGAVACATSPTAGDLNPQDEHGDGITVGGSRPARVFLPPSYDPTIPTPLLLVLHGYSESGAEEDAYFGMARVAAAHGLIYAHPDGTLDPTDTRFWNATPGCCDLFESGIDDSAYLRALIEEIADKTTVDRKRIYLAGHSNGGFMSYRMACDHADLIAGIASLAGAMFADPASCTPSEPVAILQIHGTSDLVIPFDGDGDVVPSAATTVRTWADFNGCASSEAGAAHDIDASIDGAEATSEVFSPCRANGHAELWTIPDGGHIPELAPSVSDQILTFLEAHPKP